ncbi:MAG: hypothetical protein Q7S79_03995 [bacterium]|nr:hypothetical protein [bacterium]
MNQAQKIGRVSHYYDKIGVAVIDLEAPLRVGDTIKFARGGEDLFDQVVESMQLDREAVQEGKNGDSVGVQTKEEVKNGAEVYLVELD